MKICLYCHPIEKSYILRLGSQWLLDINSDLILVGLLVNTTQSVTAGLDLELQASLLFQHKNYADPP